MRKVASLAACLVFMAPTFAIAQSAQEQGLSKPVIIMTSTIAKNADALKLTDEQRADLKKWIAEKKPAREAVEKETLDMRAKLKQMIIDGAPDSEREMLAQKIGENETRLVLMRSNCVNHWRETLSKEQFAQVLDLGGLKK